MRRIFRDEVDVVVDVLFCVVLPAALAIVLIVLVVASDTWAASHLSVTRTVPEGATLELRVGGRVVESVPIDAGTYSITVRRSK